MSKKTGIIISLVLAFVFTVLIVMAANHKYAQVTQKVQVAQATQFIPAGKEITDQDVKQVDVLKTDANGLAQFKDVIGKTTSVSILQGQYVYQNGLSTAKTLKSGYVEIYVPVDPSSSAFAMPGDLVNVHIIDKKNGQSSEVLKNVLVLDCRNSQGDEVTVGNSQDLTKVTAQQNIPTSVGLMVPAGNSDSIIYAASDKDVYLTKCPAQ